MSSGGGLAGSAFWLLAAPSYPDHDGFTVYFGSPSSQNDNDLQLKSGSQLSGAWERTTQVPQGGGRTVDAIRRHAVQVAELNRGAVPFQAGAAQGSWLGNPLLATSSFSGSVGAGATAGSTAGAGSSASMDHSRDGAQCSCSSQMS